MPPSRLVLIGIDAASSALVREWAAAGDLPTIAGLLRSGFSATIATPLGVLEGGIWPTFLTSTSPASHGMFSHLKLKPGTYDLQVGMYANRLPVPPFWTHLSRAGKRVAVIDAPFARPVRKLNGIHVTNWGAHDPWCWRRSSWPPHLIRELVRRFGSHPVDTCDAEGRSPEDYEDLRARLIAGVEKKTALLRHCLERERWDFFFGVFSESHCAGHQFWHLMDPQHPQHDRKASEALRSTIRDVYRAIDAGAHLLDRVIERLGDNGTCAAAPATRTNGSTARVSTPGRLLWTLRYLLPYELRLELKSRLPKPVATLRRWTGRPDLDPRCRMRAFAVPSNNMTGAIRINLKGREPEGRVGPGIEYEALRQEIIDGLLALENPETGRPAVQWV